MRLKVIVILLLVVMLKLNVCSKVSRFHVKRAGHWRIHECWKKCTTLFNKCTQIEDLVKNGFKLCRQMKGRCENNCRIKKRKLKVGKHLRKALKKIWGVS
eukprot:TCONS_00051884-protein